MMNLQRIRHVGIVVEDFAQSLFFYRDLLGFEEQLDAMEDSSFIDQVLNLHGSQLHTMKLAAPDGQLIELLDFGPQKERMEKRKICSPGPTHFAIQVRDIDAMYQKLSQRGVEFCSEPVLSPDSKVRLAFCRAPEGTWIEMVELVLS